MSSEHGASSNTGGVPDGWFWLWDLYFSIGFVAMIAFALGTDGTTPTGRAVMAGAMATMAVWFFAFGRRVILADQEQARPWPGRIFAFGVVALLAVGVLIEPIASIALFAVCPLIFMSLRLPEAIAVIVVANLLPAVHVLITEGPGQVLPEVGPSTMISLVLSVVLGTWVYRVVIESEERAELIKELEASREEVARLSREAGVSAERTRIAAEIHDTLAQGFTSLLTLVQAAESELDRDDTAGQDKVRRHLRLAARTARENLGEARALVAGLMPSPLGTASLEEAIRRQVERLTEETAIRTAFHVDGDLADLTTGLEVVLLRAVQESLTNVRKHASASQVTIDLLVEASNATLLVTDNGRGFDPSAAADGFGLRGMRTRAEQVGGSLRVDSGPDGTTLTVEVPR